MTTYQDRPTLIARQNDRTNTIVKTRPDEDLLEVNSPLKNTSNIGDMECYAVNRVEVESRDDFNVKMIKSGPKNSGAFVANTSPSSVSLTGLPDYPTWDDDNAMGCGCGFTWKQYLQCEGGTAAAIQNPTACEDEDGTLHLFFEESGVVKKNTRDLSDIEFGTAAKIADGSIPASCFNRSTGTILVAYKHTSNNEVNFYRRDRQGSWAFISSRVSRISTNAINGISLASMVSAGSESIYMVVFSADECMDFYRSDDLGESWTHLTDESENFYQYSGSAWTATDAHSGDGVLAVVEYGRVECLVLAFRDLIGEVWGYQVFFSHDGVTWNQCGYDNAAGAGEGLSGRAYPAIIQANQKTFQQAHTPEGTDSMFSGVTFMSKCTDDDAVQLYQCATVSENPQDWQDRLPGSDWYSLEQRVFYSMDDDTDLNAKDLFLAKWKGRPVLFFVINNGTYDHLMMAENLSWTTAPESKRSTYNYIPALGNDWANIGWGITSAGAAVSTYQDGDLHITTAGVGQYSIDDDAVGQVFYTTGNLRGGVKIRFVVKTVAEVNEHRILQVLVSDIEDVAAARAFVQLVIRMDEDGITLKDFTSSADLTTIALDMTEYHEFIVSIGSPTTDIDERECAIWYRPYDSDVEKFEVEAFSLTLDSDAGGTQQSELHWGVVLSSTAENYWKYLQYSAKGAYDSTDIPGDYLWNDYENNHLMLCRRNGARVCSGKEQYLDLGYAVSWGAGSGFGLDNWHVFAKARHAIENMLDENPRTKWQTSEDAYDAVTELVDAQTSILTSYLPSGYGGFIPLGIGLIGTNFENCTVYFDQSNAFAAPAITLPLTSVLATGVYEGVQSTYTSNSCLAEVTMKDFPTIPPEDSGTGKKMWHYRLDGMYLKFTSGAADGNVYKIQTSIALDYDYLTFTAHKLINLTFANNGDPDADGASINDTFVIFSDRMISLFYSEDEDAAHLPFSHMKIVIPQQQSADQNFQIKNLVVGGIFDLQRPPSFPYDFSQNFNVDLQYTRGGLASANRLGPMKRSVSLSIDPRSWHETNYFMSFVEKIGGPLGSFLYCPTKRQFEGTAPKSNEYSDMMNDGWLARFTNAKNNIQRANAAMFFASGSISIEEIT